MKPSGIISAATRSTHRGRSRDHPLSLSLCARPRNPLDITRDGQTNGSQLWSATATAVAAAANTEIIASSRGAIFSEAARERAE